MSGKERGISKSTAGIVICALYILAAFGTEDLLPVLAYADIAKEAVISEEIETKYLSDEYERWTEPVNEERIVEGESENILENDDEWYLENTNIEILDESYTRNGHRVMKYDFTRLTEYDELMETFFTTDPYTYVNRDEVNLDNLLYKDYTIDKNQEGYQILIYHTHSSETYADSNPNDPSTTIMGAGAYLAKLLSDEYGYHVLYHQGRYDTESRDYAYENALPDIEAILNEHPEISVVIDLHRDGVDENVRLVTDINGKKTAKFMFFAGLSRTRQNGDISYLPNPYREDNIAVAFQLQVAANEFYPGLTRKIYLKGYRYNMHLRPRNILVELGAQTNTVEEALNACEPLAHVLDIVLSGVDTP